VSDVELNIVDDPARAVADLLLDARGHVALAGGSTPKRAYELARERRDWSEVTFWWSDERCVPPDDERSNYGMAKAALLDHVELGEVHRIRGELGGEAAAGVYEELLKGVQIDLCLLGLGPDGHIASLFPHAPGLDEAERLAIPAEPKLDPYVERVTLTPPALRAARSIVFLVTGAEKADAVARALGGPPDPAVPGSLIRADGGQTLAILDKDAAARLLD
jgi:6-phosphogluconolactonase